MKKPDPKKLAVDIPANLHEAIFNEARHCNKKTKIFVAAWMEQEPGVSKRLAALMKDKGAKSNPAKKAKP